MRWSALRYLHIPEVILSCPWLSEASVCQRLPRLFLFQSFLLIFKFIYPSVYSLSPFGGLIDLSIFTYPKINCQSLSPNLFHPCLVDGNSILPAAQPEDVEPIFNPSLSFAFHRQSTGKSFRLYQ